MVRITGARIAGLLLCGALMLGTGSASAQQLVQNGFTGAEVRAAAAKVYQSLQLTEDPYGDPMIIVNSGAKPFLIGFYACDDKGTERCQILRFLTYETGPFGDDMLARVNGFNNNSMFGRAAIDEDKDVAFDWVITVAGATPAYIEQQIVLWENVALKTFLKEVVGKGGPKGPGERQQDQRPEIEAFAPAEAILPVANVAVSDKTAGLKARLTETHAPDGE